MNYRATIVFILIALAWSAWFWLTTNTDIHNSFDLLGLWGASKVSIQNGNPYNYQQLLAITKSADPSATAWPVFNPPWTFALFAPLASLPFDQAISIWVCISCIMVGACIALCANLWALPKQHLQKFLVATAVLSFYPAYFHLRTGQITIVCALGWTLFLSLRNNPGIASQFAAGAALGLTFFKPQLFLLVYGAVAYAALQRKRFMVPCGMLVMVTLGITATLVINSSLFENYFSIFPGPRYWRNFVLGVFSGGLTDSAIPWLKYTPLVIAIILLSVAAFRRTLDNCSNSFMVGVLLPGSIVVAPHLHPYDLIVLLPSIIWAYTHPITHPRLGAALLGINLIVQIGMCSGQDSYGSVLLWALLLSIICVITFTYQRRITVERLTT